MLLGIEIGGTKLQLVLGGHSARIHRRWRLTVRQDAGAAGIHEQIERTLPSLVGRRKIAAVGVGFGGPVDWRTGRIARSHQIEGWSGFGLAAWLRRRIGAPVFVDNDANVGALGEATRGAGAEARIVFFCTLGSGVGGGLVVDRNIFHGASPGEVELGHLVLDRRGTLVENRCSGWAVDRKVRRAARRYPKSLLAELVRQAPGAEAKLLVPALRRRDALARRILEETADDLAFGLSHVTHLLHPEVLVLGGGLAGLGEPLRRAVQGALEPRLMEVFRPGPRVCVAALGEDSIPVGALALAAQSIRS